jgi:malate synthase
VRNSVVLDDGQTVTAELVRSVLAEVRAELAELPHLDEAAELFDQVALADDFVDFLTLPAYDKID